MTVRSNLIWVCTIRSSLIWVWIVRSSLIWVCTVRSNLIWVLFSPTIRSSRSASVLFAQTYLSQYFEFLAHLCECTGRAIALQRGCWLCGVSDGQVMGKALPVELSCMRTGPRG